MQLSNILNSCLTGNSFSIAATIFSSTSIQQLFQALLPNGTLTLNGATLQQSTDGNTATVTGTAALFAAPQLQCTASFSNLNTTPAVQLAFSNFPQGWLFSSAFPALKGCIPDSLTLYQVQLAINSSPDPSTVLQTNFQTTWGDLPDPAELDAHVIQGIGFSAAIQLKDLPSTLQWLFASGGQTSIALSGQIELHNVNQQQNTYLPKLWIKSAQPVSFTLISHAFPLTLEFISLFSQNTDSQGNYFPDCFGRLSTSSSFTINKQADAVPFYAKFYGLQPLIISVDAYFAGATTPITIDEIPQIIGLDSLNTYLPATVPALDDIELVDIGFDLDAPGNQVQNVTLTVGTTPAWSWSFLNKFKFHDVKVQFYIGSPADAQNRYVGISLFGDVDIDTTTLQGSIYLPAMDFNIQMADNTTFDIKSWVEGILATQLSTTELVCTAFSLSGNITNNQYSFFAQVSSNLGFSFENTQVTLQQVQVQLSVGSSNSVMLYGQFLVGKVPINVGFSYAGGAWQLQGGTMQTSQIPLGQFITYFAQKFGFGASVPQAVQNLIVDTFFFSYNSGTHDFSGQFSLSESQPVTIGGHQLNITLQVSFNRQAGVNGAQAQLDFQFTGQLQVSGQEFEVNLQEDASGFSFQAEWQAQDGKGIGFEDLAQALGIDHNLSVPSNFNLSLTSVAISYTDQNDQFAISAATPQGNAFLVTQKDASGNAGFIFGVNLSNITTASSIPGYGTQFQVVDSLNLQQFGLVLSTAAFPDFTAPAFPALPGTTTPLVIDLPAGPIIEGASLTAKIDFTKAPGVALQKAGSLIGQETLTLAIAYDETSKSVKCSATLAGDLNLSTSKGSNFVISNVLFYIQLSDDNVSVNLQGSSALTLFNTPYNVTARITVSDDEAEITFDLAESQTLPSPPQLSTLQLAELGLGAGIEFEPPSIDFSLEGKIVIGQDQDDFALVLEIEDVVLNPALLTFQISDWTLGDAVNHFSSHNGAGIDFVTVENLFFYWCETPQILPDGAVAQPGFAFSCGLKLWDFSGYGCFQIDAANGVSGMVELAPIQWGSFFSLTGNGQGIADPVPSIAASLLPSLYGSNGAPSSATPAPGAAGQASPPAPAAATTTAGPVAAPSPVLVQPASPVSAVAIPGISQLGTGQLMQATGFLQSANGLFYAILQQDGNFVLYQRMPQGVNVLWSSKSGQSSLVNWTLTMQADGNLVLYDQQNNPHWATATNSPNNTNTVLLLQSDGNLVLYKQGKTGDPSSAVWSSATSNSALAQQNLDAHILATGQALLVNQPLVSPLGQYYLLLQQDASLILYQRTAQGNKPLWNSGTQGKGGINCQLKMQADGNLVLYNEQNQAIWSSNTYNPSANAGSNLVIQDDGNLVIYKNNQTGNSGDITWTSNTQQATPPSTQNTAAAVPAPGTASAAVPVAVPAVAPAVASASSPVIANNVSGAPAKYFVAPGGPVMQFSSAGDPYFNISLQLSILDLEQLDAEGTLDQNGFSFEVDVQELIFNSKLSCSYSSTTGFSASASVTVGVQNQQIDVLGISFNLTCDVQGSMSIQCTSGNFSLSLTGSFDFEGHTFTLPAITLDASFGGFSNLASHVLSAIVSDAENIFGGAIGDLKKIGTAIATGVEDAGKAVAAGVGDAATAVASGAETVASDAESDVSSAASTVANAASSAASAVANAAGSAETAVSHAASGAWDDIKSWA
jgi:hypothetical protein